MPTNPKSMTIASWVITALISAGLLMSGIMKLMAPEDFAKEFVERLGYPLQTAKYLGIAELTCLALYLFPRTRYLGAILLTGYCGGAIATHVRIMDNFAGAAVLGVLVWLALYLREPKLRTMIPWSAQD